MDRPQWDPPPPPGVGPVKGPGTWRLVVAAALIVGLLVAAFTVSIPLYYSEIPGPARDVETLVEVDGADDYSSEGSLFLTTVRIDTQVTFVDVLSSFFDEDRTLVSRDQFTGGGSLEDLQRQARADMRTSKRNAEQVALGALGLGIAEGDGAEIAQIVVGSPAHQVLEVGDVIVRIGGEPVVSTCDVGRVLDAHSPGEPIEVIVMREGAGGETRRIREDIVPTTNPDHPGGALLGVLMNDVNYSFDTDVEVKIETDGIGGPSAGLMITLALYDRLTPDDLTGGRAIAGTGTISCDGGVGPIGGVELKVAAAEREGAAYFFAPIANFEAASSAADSIEVVGIASFADAVEFLEGLN